MDQALENIRNRVDAFGVGEPQIAVSGTTIDVQIPGGANGTVEERQKTAVLPRGQRRRPTTGAPTTRPRRRRRSASSRSCPSPSQVCLNDPAGHAARVLREPGRRRHRQGGRSPSSRRPLRARARPRPHPSRRPRRPPPRPVSTASSTRPAPNWPATRPEGGRTDGSEGPHDQGDPHEVLHHRRWRSPDAARRLRRRPPRRAPRRPRARPRSRRPLRRARPRPPSPPHTRSSTRTAPTTLPCGLSSKATAEAALQGSPSRSEDTSTAS